MVITSGPRLPNRHLYALEGSPSPPPSVFATFTPAVPTTDTRHRRLGHPAMRTVYDMARSDRIPGMHVDLSLAPPTCQSCILGKQTRASVPKVREGPKAGRALELVFVDVQGPFSTLSSAGNLYSLDILDNATSMIWCIPIPNKAMAFDCFKNW